MKITLEQVLDKSNARLSIGPDSGKKVLERNLEKMKNWKKSRIEFFFDENGRLIREPRDESKDDWKIISSSRKHVRKSLQSIIKDAKMKDDKIKTPVGGVLGKFTSQLISRENIMGKFKNAEVDLNPEEND